MNDLEERSWGNYWNSNKIEELETPYWTEFYTRSINQLGVIKPSDVVLDFGAGWGTVGEQIFPLCKELYLLDASEKLCDLMRHRFRDIEKVKVIATLDEIPMSVDVILVNSVFQYIPLRVGIEIFKSFSKVCIPGSRLVISDLVPLKYSKIVDLLYLIVHTSYAGHLPGFIRHVLRAIRHSSKSNLTDKLERYESGFVLKVLKDLDFHAEILPRNLTPSSRRYSIFAKKVVGVQT